MSRGFSGSRSGGGGGGGTFGSFNHQKRSAKDMFIKKMKGEDDQNLSADEKYKKMVEEKTEAYKKEAMKGTRFGVSLPGTDAGQEGRQLSASALEMIEKLARDKAKKAAKKAKRKEINITPKFLTGMQGGKIDSEGRVYDKHNRVVAKIDKKTGKVKANNGTHICTYNGSSFSEYSIARFLEKQNSAQGGSIYSAKGHGGTTSAGNVWGGGNSSSGTDMWGNKKDDGGGGFWG